MPKQLILTNKGQLEIYTCPKCGGFVSARKLFKNKVHIYCTQCGLSGLQFDCIYEALRDWNQIQPIDTNSELI